MHTYKPFFSEELFSTYNAFMREAFSTYGAAGTNARIRSEIENGNGSRRLHNEHGWKPEWEYCFTEEENSAAQLESYNRFLTQLARDLKL
ncbi:hypothetical protein [Pseudomonas kuykendallii]|uniref:hypothetical protein n=1 Tax=Pseudomonas kuykendallii TaxID=1007099 RepID=UPI0028D4245E|nr:hypothetical protein [Pseudomonas kuykendallii]